MDYKNISRTISYILRHHPEEYNLELDEHGYVNIDLLLKAISNKNNHMRPLTRDDLNHIIETADQERWEIKDNKIRAYCGHSLKQEIKHEEEEPPKYLYHGTGHSSINTILKEGLLPMQRQYVHLSEDKDLATIVGKRKDKHPVILIIDSKKAYQEGIKFYHEKNNIWLTKKIPNEYIKLYKEKV